MQVSQVKKEGTLLKEKWYEEGWVLKGAVNQPGMKGGPH
jgi:hypothetical protein